MYDRDVQLLQFCGANLDPDQFLVHLLNKFSLVNWASKVGKEETGEFLGATCTREDYIQATGEFRGAWELRGPEGLQGPLAVKLCRGSSGARGEFRGPGEFKGPGEFRGPREYRRPRKFRGFY